MNFLKTRKVFVTAPICRASASTIAPGLVLTLGPHLADTADTWMEIKTPRVTVLANGARATPGRWRDSLNRSDRRW